MRTGEQRYLPDGSLSEKQPAPGWMPVLKTEPGFAACGPFTVVLLPCFLLRLAND